jgi:hypothetical protein
MNQSSEPQAGQAYTRASVETYLRAAAEERRRMQSAIAEAQARTAQARTAQAHRMGQHLQATHNTEAVPVVDGYDQRRPAVVENSDSLTQRLPFGLNGEAGEWRQQDLPAAATRD